MPEFKGWHSRGYLPHFDSPETTQFVTFRLADSLPRQLADPQKPPPDAFDRLERQLDSGLGACWLGQPEIAALVERAFLHFDGSRYRLIAWCIMPNHVHVLVTLSGSHTLTSIVGSWKSFTAKQANAVLGRSGAFWEADYFDRYIRSEEHFAWTVAYTENNPVKAGLCTNAAEWPWGSARFKSGA